MKRKQNRGFLYQGSEVVTDDLRIAYVESYRDESNVTIRYHSPPWPFPQWETKTRKQLTSTDFVYEDAPF